MGYAEKTKVSVNQTKAGIEDLLIKYGDDQFISGYRDSLAVIGFSIEGRQVKITLPLPDKFEPEFWYTPERRTKRSETTAFEAWQQACRAKWRSLYAIVKAKLIAVEEGISTIEREFFYDVVLPDGKTVGEWMAPQLEAVYQTGNMPPMLPIL